MSERKNRYPNRKTDKQSVDLNRRKAMIEIAKWSGITALAAAVGYEAFSLLNTPQTEDARIVDQFADYRPRLREQPRETIQSEKIPGLEIHNYLPWFIYPEGFETYMQAIATFQNIQYDNLMMKGERNRSIIGRPANTTTKEFYLLGKDQISGLHPDLQKNLASTSGITVHIIDTVNNTGHSLSLVTFKRNETLPDIPDVRALVTEMGQAMTWAHPVINGEEQSNTIYPPGNEAIANGFSSAWNYKLQGTTFEEFDTKFANGFINIDSSIIIANRAQWDSLPTGPLFK